MVFRYHFKHFTCQNVSKILCHGNCLSDWIFSTEALIRYIRLQKNFFMLDPFDPPTHSNFIYHWCHVCKYRLWTAAFSCSNSFTGISITLKCCLWNFTSFPCTNSWMGLHQIEFVSLYELNYVFEGYLNVQIKMWLSCQIVSQNHLVNLTPTLLAFQVSQNKHNRESTLLTVQVVNKSVYNLSAHHFSIHRFLVLWQQNKFFPYKWISLEHLIMLTTRQS